MQITFIKRFVSIQKIPVPLNSPFFVFIIFNTIFLFKASDEMRQFLKMKVNSKATGHSKLSKLNKSSATIIKKKARNQQQTAEVVSQNAYLRKKYCKKIK